MPELLERLRELTDELVPPDLFVRLVETLPDALVVIKKSGEIVFFNGQAEFLFGYSRTEVLGRTIDMLVPEVLRERHAEHRDVYMQQPRLRPMGIGMALSARTKDGGEIPVEINLSPLQVPEGLFVSAVVRRRTQ